MYLNKNAWGQLQETLTANEQELQLLRNNAEQFRAGFAAKDRIIRQLQANHQQSTEKDCVTHHLKSDIQQLQTMINKKDSALGHLQADVLSKDRTIQQLQSNPAAMRDSTGEHVHLGIKQLQLAISGKDRKLERLNSIVQNQDMQLQRQKHDINMKDKKLKDRNIQVQQLDDDLWHTSRALADLQIEYDKCSSDEELLQERSSLLADRAQLYEAQATIAELEEQYSEQRAELLRVDSVVDSLTTDVEYYEERISELLCETDDQAKQLVKTQSALDDVTQGFAHLGHYLKDCESKAAKYKTLYKMAKSREPQLKRRVLGLERHLIALLIMNRELQASQELRRSW